MAHSSTSVTSKYIKTNILSLRVTSKVSLFYDWASGTHEAQALHLSSVRMCIHSCIGLFFHLFCFAICFSCLLTSSTISLLHTDVALFLAVITFKPYLDVNKNE